VAGYSARKTITPRVSEKLAYMSAHKRVRLHVGRNKEAVAEFRVVFHQKVDEPPGWRSTADFLAHAVRTLGDEKLAQAGEVDVCLRHAHRSIAAAAAKWRERLDRCRKIRPIVRRNFRMSSDPRAD